MHKSVFEDRSELKLGLNDLCCNSRFSSSPSKCLSIQPTQLALFRRNAVLSLFNLSCLVGRLTNKKTWVRRSYAWLLKLSVFYIISRSFWFNLYTIHCWLDTRAYKSHYTWIYMDLSLYLYPYDRLNLSVIMWIPCVSLLLLFVCFIVVNTKKCGNFILMFLFLFLAACCVCLPGPEIWVCLSFFQF